MNNTSYKRFCHSSVQVSHFQFLKTRSVIASHREVSSCFTDFGLLLLTLFVYSLNLLEDLTYFIHFHTEKDKAYYTCKDRKNKQADYNE